MTHLDEISGGDPAAEEIGGRHQVRHHFGVEAVDQNDRNSALTQIAENFGEKGPAQKNHAQIIFGKKMPGHEAFAIPQREPDGHAGVSRGLLQAADRQA